MPIETGVETDPIPLEKAQWRAVAEGAAVPSAQQEDFTEMAIMPQEWRRTNLVRVSRPTSKRIQQQWILVNLAVSADKLDASDSSSTPISLKVYDDLASAPPRTARYSMPAIFSLAGARRPLPVDDPDAE